MRNWTRDDPIADAEDYATDTRPVLGCCPICGIEIHAGTATYDPDDAYQFTDGVLVCEDHLHEYFKEYKLK